MLYPWKQTVKDLAESRESQKIQVILDPQGNTGKTTLVRQLEFKGIAMLIPFTNNPQKMNRMIYEREPKPAYFVDVCGLIPRDTQGRFYQSLEVLKDGYQYTNEPEYEYRVVDAPNVFVFMKEIPDMTLLRGDKWEFWTIDANKYLVPLQVGE